MAKIIDYITLTIVTLLVTFCWAALAFNSPIGALIFSCALTLAVVVTVKYVRSKRNKPYTYDRLALEFSIRGNEYVINLLKCILKNADIESGSNYILLENCIIVSAFKFGLLNIGDIGNVCSLALKNERRVVYVIARGVERKAFTVAQSQRLKLEIVKIRTVFKLLEKRHALPDLAPVKTKFSLKLLLETALSRSNFKSYIFSGVVLLLVSFITPYKIYYITIGSILILIALLTLTPLGNGTVNSPHFVKEINAAANRLPDQISIDEL